MILLGSTGSIGVNTLKIAQEFNLNVEALVAGNNYKLLNEQIKTFKPKYVVVKDKKTADKIDFKNVSYGEEAILDIIEKSNSNIVVNALVGSAGIKPTLKTLSLNKKLALANKESLVIAGKFIDTTNITPVDSEHFGLWYSMHNCKSKIKKMIITASGGALRDYDINDMQNIKIQDVLNHPNWSMGKKITVDSATMVNKLFELLEAKWLFNVSNLDAIIETKSIIHSFIDFVDGSTIAHIAKADMRLPIAFALMGSIEKEIVSHIDFTKIGNLEFREIDTKRYPIWSIKDKLLKKPELGVILNEADEIAVSKFLNGKISFTQMVDMILDIFQKYENIKINNINDVFLLQKEIRESYII